MPPDTILARRIETFKSVIRHNAARAAKFCEY